MTRLAAQKNVAISDALGTTNRQMASHGLCKQLEALLGALDRSTRLGRRDNALLVTVFTAIGGCQSLRDPDATCSPRCSWRARPRKASTSASDCLSENVPDGEGSDAFQDHRKLAIGPAKCADICADGCGG